MSITNNIINQYLKYLSFLDLDLTKEKWSENFMACKSDGKLLFANRVFIPHAITQKDLADLKSFFSDLPFTLWLNKVNNVGKHSVEELGITSKVTLPLMQMDLRNLELNIENPDIKVKQLSSRKEILSLWVSLVSEAYNMTAVIHEFQKFVSYLLATK